jgi:tetratricopeptide (TPR) repeat protein
VVGYLDRGDYVRAQNHLEKSLAQYDSLSSGMKQGFALEAAFFWAFHLKDLDIAIAWLDRGQGGIVEPAARSRVEAAVLMLRGDSQQALEKIQQARTQLRSSVDLGGAKAEFDMLQEIEASLVDQLAFA